MAEDQRADSAGIVGFGVGLGIIASILIFQRQQGLGFTLYVIALLGSLFLCARLQRVRPVRRNLPMLIPILFFAAMLTLRADLNLSTLNLVMGIFAALLLIYFFTNGSIAQQDLIQYGVKAGVSAIAVWVQPLERLYQATGWFAARRKNWGSLMPVLRGIIITVPVVAIFVILLSSADTVFSDFVGHILQIFTFHGGLDFAGQVAFAVLFGWTAIGGLAFALLPRKNKRAPTAGSVEPLLSDALLPEVQGKPVEKIPALKEAQKKELSAFLALGFTESTMLLGSICAVFSAFVVIQFVYLFGGQGNITVAKFNYADYVHRGFIELIIVSLMTLVLAYLLNMFAVRQNRHQLNILRVLLTLLVVLTGVILVSAFQRLRLYEDVYGLTSLRLVILIFIVWLGILFAGFALSLYWQPPMVNVFGVATLITVFGFVATLNVINPDAYVARAMINRNDVDPLYLISLSDEAVPQMVSLVDAPQPGLQSIVRNDLFRRWQAALQANTDWRDFNVTESSAYAALASVKDKLGSNTGYLTHTEDDFTVLKAGMTYREVVRQLGKAQYNSSDSVDSSIDGSARVTLVLQYPFGDNQLVDIDIDTVNGVTSACVDGSTPQDCMTLSQTGNGVWNFHKPVHIPTSAPSDVPKVAAVTTNSGWIPRTQTVNEVDMVVVPPGCFAMGSSLGETNENPVTKICFDQAFWLDKTEVTQAQFKQLKGQAATAPAFIGDTRPVDNITWQEASAFCALRGARLPTEAEWEYAARGPSDLEYPWGNYIAPMNAVDSDYSFSQTSQVGTKLNGASWVGALDMSGNVWEWTSSLYNPYPYDPIANEKNGDTIGPRVLRGGSWNSAAETLRTTYRYMGIQSYTTDAIGFRCARS